MSRSASCSSRSKAANRWAATPSSAFSPIASMVVARPGHRNYREEQDAPARRATSSPSAKKRSAATPRARPRLAALYRRSRRLLRLRRRPPDRAPARARPKTNSACPTPASCSSTRSSPSTTSRKRSCSSSPPMFARRNRKPPTKTPSRRLNRLAKKLPRPLPSTKPKQRSRQAQDRIASTKKKDFLNAVERSQGVHRRRRRLSGRPLAALRRRTRSRSLRHLPRAAHRESLALHVLPALRTGSRAKKVSAEPRTSSARRRSCWFASRAGVSSTVPSPARARVRRAKTQDLRIEAELLARREGTRRARHARRPRPQRRRPRQRVSAASRSRTSCSSSATRTSCTWSARSRAG